VRFDARLTLGRVHCMRLTVAELAQSARMREVALAAGAQSGSRTMELGVADVLFRQVRIHGFWCAPPATTWGRLTQCKRKNRVSPRCVIVDLLGRGQTGLILPAVAAPCSCDPGMQSSASALHPAWCHQQSQGKRGCKLPGHGHGAPCCRLNKWPCCRLNKWLESLGDKAPEVLSTLVDLLAKGAIAPSSGAWEAAVSLPATACKPHRFATSDSPPSALIGSPRPAATAVVLCGACSAKLVRRIVCIHSKHMHHAWYPLRMVACTAAVSGMLSHIHCILRTLPKHTGRQQPVQAGVEILRCWW
jgi:hypothetical protein